MFSAMRHWKLSILGLGVLAIAACSSGVSQDEVDARDRQIEELQGQVTSLQSQVAGLEEHDADFERDARYWEQLAGLLEPVELASMTDHRATMLPSGIVLAVHHDDMNLDNAENLNWLAFGVPGRFCKDDHERVTAEFGPGFTHFHDMEADTHGGEPGAEGVWFVHIAVRDFESPMSGGAVQQGIDENFMPTEAPDC